jgi:ABC-type Fe3+/spermidine/putrescine transport system ATPase subunit
LLQGMTAPGDRGSAVSDQDVLRFEGVSRTFTGFAAVDDVTLGLRRGEILTLLGPSGCGKTTTLRMAIGLERCTSGRILYRDAVVDAPEQRIYVPPERRDMGMVFQSYAVWPHMTVFENVAFPLRARKVPRAQVEARVASALALVGLEQHAERFGTQLSGGQQQRVAIARGLVFNPDVLLMDEPFSNLDAHLRDQMRGEIKVLQRELGISVLFVTHDQSEALALSDRLAVMRGGRMEQAGTPLELYSHPGTPFVRDFLGRWIKLSATILERRGSEARVRLADGTELTAGGAMHVAAHAGTAVELAIRPEHVECAPNSAVQPDNPVRATVRTLLFLGRAFEANLTLSTGASVLVDLSANRAWSEGQQIVLAVPPSAVTIWPPAELA